jgi:hypothetical protein
MIGPLDQTEMKFDDFSICFASWLNANSDSRKQKMLPEYFRFLSTLLLNEVRMHPLLYIWLPLTCLC